MGNSMQTRNGKIAFVEIYTDEKNRVETPKGKTLGAFDIELYGEMSIILKEYIGLKNENGKTEARIDHKYPELLVSKNLDEKTSIEAAKKYMKEKGYKSIAEIVKAQEIKSKQSTKKASAYSRD